MGFHQGEEFLEAFFDFGFGFLVVFEVEFIELRF